MTAHYLFMKTHLTFSRKISNRAQKELGLSPGQPKVLDCLLVHEGSDQKTIAANCEIEQATLGSILLRMEESGLVERRQQNGNRRSLFVYFTPKGREVAEKMKAIFEEEDAAALSALSTEEQQNLIELLTRVCAKINEKTGVCSIEQNNG